MKLLSWNDTSINVGKTIIIQAIFDGLYHHIPPIKMVISLEKVMS